MIDVISRYLTYALAYHEPWNDWITHIPALWQPVILCIGRLIALMIGA